MGRSVIIIIGFIGILLPFQVVAQQPVTIAVMEFSSKGGVTQDQMDALSDLVANQIRTKGDFRVIGKSDIQSMLTLEEHRQRLTTCTDQECLAEIGGALGVRWMIVGNVGLFGKTYLLNLKLIDVKKALVASGISRTIVGGEDKLLKELPEATDELFDKAPNLNPVSKASKTTLPMPQEKSQKSDTYLHQPTQSYDRKGKLALFVSTGLTGYIDGDSSGSEAYHFDFIKDSKWAMSPNISIGYHFLDWLCLNLRVGSSIAFSTIEDGNGAINDKVFGSLDTAIVADLVFPISQSFNLLATFSSGFSWITTKTDEPIDAYGFSLDAGTGIELPITPQWMLRGFVIGTIRMYPKLDWGEYTDKDAKVTIFGITSMVSSGWIF